ncbi:MAG: hypothetical protein ACXWRE_08685 [Pseudobdellovibrionaceae bacterium]
MFHSKPLLAAALLLFSLDSPAYSSPPNGSGGGDANFSQRAERRESSRWTLQEWMAQKDKIRMMDLWLSMNSPSPYELMLGISYNSYNLETTGSGITDSHTSYLGSFSAYAQFVGLTAEYENNVQEHFNDLNGIFNLRLLGNSIQGSYLAIHYGLHTRTQASGTPTPAGRYSQQFSQASLQMYAIKNFGFDGLYRLYSPMSDSTLGNVKGNLTEAGAFIDFKNFRVFGTWYKEVQQSELNNVTAETTRTGIRSGLKIFF